MGQVGAVEQAALKLTLLAAQFLSGGGGADQPLQQPKQQREEQVKPLAVGSAAKPLHQPVQARPVELGQPAEACEEIAVELNALAGGKLERAAHAALAQSERGRKRLRIDLVAVAVERGADRLLQILLTKRSDTKRPAAGANGDGNSPFRRRHQEEQRPLAGAPPAPSTARWRHSDSTHRRDRR